MTGRGHALVAAIAAAVCLTAGACSPSSPSTAAGQHPTGRNPEGRNAVAPAHSAAAADQAVGRLPAHPPTAGAPAAADCARPVFHTSDPRGGWSTHGYFVYNNMWNDSVPLGPQTLYACAYDNWYVVSNQTDDAGAVKTYPNVHKDYHEPTIASFSRLSSSFAASGPRAGIYNVAFDIWIDGIATSDSTEVMIWTENFHQVPAGSRTATVTLGGRTYDVWRTDSGRYLAFVARSAIRAGTLNLLEFLKWTVAQGYLAASSTLGQVGFGVEIVSTGGRSQTFSFTDFSLTGG